MTIPMEEVLVFALLLAGVFVIYYALKLHYVFAFKLVQKTNISEAKKEKIEKIKIYVFYFLKVLLILALFAMIVFDTSVLMQGMSLKALVIEWWHKIPEGFWLSLLWTLLRIALLIVVARYLLKKIYTFLEKQEERTIAKKRYNKENVSLLYLRIHNTIKYTFVLGVVYRIVHFFPFLLEVSYLFLLALLLFFLVASGITIREFFMMRDSQNI
ncbi:MAG TPA: hypothetical protein EYH57_04980 [Sulfurovum sp.]|nr:hypothetical protein [Sulfurovum sp.]